MNGAKRTWIPAVVGVLAGAGVAQELPPEVAAWVPPAPDGYTQQQVRWNPENSELTVSYGQWTADRLSVVIDGRQLAADAAIHEFWRTPVTWKRQVEAFGDDFVIGGMTDQAMGPDYSGTCGVTWRTTDGLRILVQWQPGRSPRAHSWTAVAQAVEDLDRGQVPQALIRSYLARHPSALREDSRRDGPAWAAAELRRFWDRFGEVLASDRPSAEIIHPNAFPFAIPFLQFRFTWDLTREQRRDRHAELTQWIGTTRPADFEWDRRAGEFRFRTEEIRQARPVAVPRRRAVDPNNIRTLRADRTWELGLPIARGAQSPYEPLWTVVEAGGQESLFVLTKRDERYELTVLELHTGKLLRRAVLRFAHINHLRFVDGRLFLDITEAGVTRYGELDLDTLAVQMNADASPLLRELYPPRWGWEVTQQALGLTPDRGVESVLERESGIYVRAATRPDPLLYALETDEHRARWVARTVLGTKVISEPGRIYARMVSGDWPTWAALDSQTGAVRWVLGLRNHGLWNAGLAAGRIALVGGPEVYLIDARSGRILGRMPLVEPIERTAVDGGRLGLHLGSRGILTVSGSAAANATHRLRFYRWP